MKRLVDPIKEKKENNLVMLHAASYDGFSTLGPKHFFIRYVGLSGRFHSR